MRLERTTKKPGGGGRTAYSSDSFSVVVWSLAEGAMTTIQCHLTKFLKISFDGECAFRSDDECIEQFTAEEILGVIEVQKGRAFTKGQESKAQQIRDCLAL